MNQEDLALLVSPKPKYDNAPVLSGDALILADLHVPYQDGDFLLHMLELAKDWHIPQGIVAGDFFNEAAFSFLNTKHEAKDWPEEVAIAENVFLVMHRYVPNWLLMLGNHDAYILRFLEGQIFHQDILKMANMDALATDYYYAIVQDKQGNNWRVSHPRNVSSMHGSIPKALASKYSMNVIAGHGHLASLSPDDSGIYCCIDSGICCDPDRLDYTSERDNTRPKMNQGAVILKEVNGRIYPYLIQPQWTDWDALKRLY